MSRKITDRLLTTETNTESYRDLLRKILSPPTILILPIILIITVVFLGSILFILVYSFQTGNTIDPGGWTLQNYSNMISSDLFYNIVLDTILISGVTTALAFVISYPAAYALSKKVSKTKNILLVALIIPLVTDINIRVFGWVVLLIKDGIFFEILRILGTTPTESILYSYPATIIGTTYIYLPFMLFPIFVSFESLDHSLLEAAEDLGANRLQILRSVILPLSMPGVAIGALFVFVLSLGAQVEASMLGGDSIIVVANDISYSFGYQQDWGAASAKAMALVLLATLTGTFILKSVDLQEIARRS